MSQENNSYENSWKQGKQDAESGKTTPGGQRPGESSDSYQTRQIAFDSTKASQSDSGSKK